MWAIATNAPTSWQKAVHVCHKTRCRTCWAGNILAIVITRRKSPLPACNRSLNDVYMMIIAGIVGYVLQKLDFALPPIILGVILGGMIEKNFRRALILSNGDVGTFFTRPISCVFIVLAVVSLFSPVIKTVIASKKAKKQAAAAAVNDNESSS